MVTPTQRQLKHHAREFYGFIHFTTNTFTDKEWGFGDELPGVFNPTAFDADQIVDSAKLAGMRGLILTCKHHDGFCLWPSRYTEHSVRNSPFRNGRGDVVREVEQACRRAGLEFGVYLSPWDRNHGAYGSGEYVAYYQAQLRELLTEYGELFEVWFDGANGGDGFYGGAREKRTIDNRTYYGWDRTWELVRQLQPDAVMFSDAGRDVRWVGNEAGIAGDPCWCTIKAEGLWPGSVDQTQLNRGDRDGSSWLIPECDVSIRPGWFYHAAEDDRVRSARNLVDLYFASVGRGATFLLNLPPDRRGLIPDADRASLRGFRQHLDRLFERNLAAGAVQMGGWQAGAAGPEWVIAIDLPVAQQVSVLDLREEIALGHRVYAWVLEMREEGEAGRWQVLAQGQAIGARRLSRFAPITAMHFRVRITETCAEPAITTVGLYLEPELTEGSTQTVAGVRATVLRKSADELVLDLGKVIAIRAICYTPGVDDRADRYEIAFAEEREAWSAPASGEFGNVQFNAAPQSVTCETRGRYVRFRATRFCVGKQLAGDELSVIPG